MTLPVLTAADGAPWESGVVAAFESGSAGVRIVRRCVDVVELLALATAGQGRAALVSASLRHLDGDAVDRLLVAGVAVVAVVTRPEVETERVRALGVQHVVPADADPAVVASVLLEALRATSTDTAVSGRTARMFGGPAGSTALPPGTPDPAAVPLPERTGSVIAVWGPTGAPGRTTVAIGLADELSRLGCAALLVDADVYGGTVAAALGLLDDSPGLAAACRQAAAGTFDPAALAALCWQLGPQLRALTGLPLASRWAEVRPAALESVLDTARGLADFTVVDCGFGLETDEELSYDTVAPRRNGATLTALDRADLIVAVGSADPVGMQRLVRGLADLRDTGATAAVWVVLNRVRRDVVPGDPRSELTGALERFAGRSPAALLPLEQAAVDTALARGRTLAEVRPSGPLRRALVELAAAVAGVPAPVAGRRRAGRWRR